MRRFFILIALGGILLFFFSCSPPVIKQDLINEAIRDVSLSDIKKDPEMYKGKLFLFGGIIINTKGTKEGSLIEALYVPVDSKGYLKETGSTQTRFLALFPKENGILDPVIFKPEREITLAAQFVEIREGKIDDMEYGYPFFKIKELYLWGEKKEYPPFYYAPYPPYWWWDYPYWDWGYPYWWRYRVPPPYWW